MSDSYKATWFMDADTVRSELKDILNASKYGKKFMDPLHSELVYHLVHLWKKNVPKSLDPTRYYELDLDTDIVKRLFDALPSIHDDYNATKPIQLEPENKESLDSGLFPRTREAYDCADVGRARLAAHNAAFVHALWPYANSTLRRVVVASLDTHSIKLWWAARKSFTLWDLDAPDELRFNSIRNTFMQYLAGLITTQQAPFEDPENPTPPCQQGELKGLTPPMDKKSEWIYYSWWIYIGRPDNLSPFPELRRVSARTRDLGGLLDWDKCAVCGSRYSKEGEDDGRKRPVHLYCSGCVIVGNPHYHHLKRRYCSEACRRLDLADHFPRCQQQKTFLHGVCFLESLARRFLEATFTGTVASYSAGPFADMPESAGKTLRRAAESHVVFPAVFSKAPWTGGSLFLKPELREEILKEAGGANHAMLAWDTGEHWYIQLRHLIVDIFKEHCDKILELSVYVRNADSISFLGNDLCRKTNTVLTYHGKNPMFWPHHVLYCRLRGTGAEFVIDLRSLIFGWDIAVLPFNVFAATRLAGIAGPSVSLFDHTAVDKAVIIPNYRIGIQKARANVMVYALTDAWKHLKVSPDIHPRNRSKLTNSLGGFLAMRDARWQVVATKMAGVMGAAFEAAAELAREEGKFRQYLRVNTNPYGHVFSVGVTYSNDQVALCEPVWMGRKTYRAIIGNTLARTVVQQDPEGNVASGPPPPFPEYDVRDVLARWTEMLKSAFAKDPPEKTPLRAKAFEAVHGDLVRLFELRGLVMPRQEINQAYVLFKVWENQLALMEWKEREGLFKDYRSVVKDLSAQFEEFVDSIRPTSEGPDDNTSHLALADSDADAKQPQAADDDTKAAATSGGLNGDAKEEEEEEAADEVVKVVSFGPDLMLPQETASYAISLATAKNLSNRAAWCTLVLRDAETDFTASRPPPLGGPQPPPGLGRPRGTGAPLGIMVRALQESGYGNISYGSLEPWVASRMKLQQMRSPHAIRPDENGGG
ncbi:hypothetical protein SODALDRAFT_401604 [Sodiomyces alkalinus F11]|uniref:MYND-type zinc finger protein samB n=1 Tax=Sodiomyces alkalinus (strain CBS 110278 / VKM F-3762 / F11) TaxID=1314773 RepID=A0A3N2PQD6_SODAK|nr:hypothetical protein SODALDRAFT_401604 [Sodiomyces alkalinus F11]ROT36719.1 hypothetical protein SODALDRAFT_401604 [Sodiomyces alkalinus F11]